MLGWISIYSAIMPSTSKTSPGNASSFSSVPIHIASNHVLIMTGMEYMNFSGSLFTYVHPLYLWDRCMIFQLESCMNVLLHIEVAVLLVIVWFYIYRSGRWTDCADACWKKRDFHNIPCGQVRLFPSRWFRHSHWRWHQHCSSCLGRYHTSSRPLWRPCDQCELRVQWS